MMKILTKLIGMNSWFERTLFFPAYHENMMFGE